MSEDRQPSNNLSLNDTRRSLVKESSTKPPTRQPRRSLPATPRPLPPPPPQSSPTISRPVLESPQIGDGDDQETPSNSSSYPTPDLFKFNSIIDAIDRSELEKSVSEIALICARAKYSLADAHASHRPPQSDTASRPRVTKKLSVVPEVNSNSDESPSNAGWRELDQQETTEWKDRSQQARQIQLTPLPGHRFQATQAPMFYQVHVVALGSMLHRWSPVTTRGPLRGELEQSSRLHSSFDKKTRTLDVFRKYGKLSPSTVSILQRQLQAVGIIPERAG